MTEKFEELVKSIEKNHWPVYGLEIRENGKLMHSYGDTGEGRYPIYSATKSFVSTAAGLAVEEGKFSVKEATSVKTSCREGGYGYFIWKYKDGFRITGKWGKRCFVFPKTGVVVTYLSDMQERSEDLTEAVMACLEP